MPTIKCPDCGYSEQSGDGEPQTCPQCDGTMAPPPRKKYQAKSSSLEEEERARKKSRARGEGDEGDRPSKKSRSRDEDEDDDRPAKKSKRALPLDEDEDDKGGGDFAQDGKAAKQLDLDPGFRNKKLMRQVTEELSRGEVLHFVCRPSAEIAKKQGLVAVAAGVFFALVGVAVAVVMFTVAKAPAFAALIPVFFVIIGVAIAVLGPVMKNRQARMGWYAVTDRRAIVFSVALWGSSGQCESYTPSELRRMWVKKSMWLKGGGDLVFKTETSYHTRTTRDHRGRSRTETTRSTTHYGFLGVEDVKAVETLVHEVLLTRRPRDEDDE